jgi:Pro-kumamolisin, activation domain/Bacterial Ig-like domain (group 3)
VSYKNRFVRVVGIASLLLSAASAPVAMGQARITSAIQNNQRVTVAESTPSVVAKSVDTGRVSGSQNLGRMLLMLTPTSDQELAAKNLVSALHDASSPSFHQWLTPAQFGQQFGVADSDAAQVQQWLQSQGFTVHEISQSRRFIVFSGNASQVENAFATEMHTYSYKGQSFISNSTNIQIPAALEAVVKGVVRLHSDPKTSASALLGTKVHFKKSKGNFTFDDGSHYMTPADFAKIYDVQALYDAGIDGTGQTIAIVGRSNISLQDVTDFRSNLGLPPNDPQVIVNGDDPGQTYYDLPEATLDVTWSGAVAPMATIKFVVSQSNFADGVDISAAYVVDHDLAPVMSTSYGNCESTLGPVGTAFYNALWQQAAAEGITAFVSSGDNGGAGCDAPGGGMFAAGGFAVNGIASTPYNMAVGGTQFDDVANPDAYWSPTTDPTTGLSVLGYIPETVWNESSNDPNDVSLWSGGGGVSTLYAKPDWQTAPGVPNDGMRDVPDISLTAALHDGYLLCLYGSCTGGGDYFYTAGGTSLSSPAAAGIMALVNQKMGGQPQGVANYVFYKLASTPGVYHDTTKGDNKVPDTNGQYTVGYDAGTGYDLATGLGSLDASALVNNWHTAASTKGSGTTLTLAGGQTMPVVHGSPIQFHAKVTCTGTCKSPSGTVVLQAVAPDNTSTAAGDGVLTAGTSSSTATLKTSTIPGGTYGITARYSGDGTYYSSTSNPVSVTVTPEPSQTYVGSVGGGSWIPNSVAVPYGEPLYLGIVVGGNSGFGYPTGQVTLQADGQPIQTGHYDGGTGLFTLGPMVLNYGEKSGVLAPGVNPTSESSSFPILPAGLAAGTHHLVASYPGDSSFAASVSTPYTFTVPQANGVLQDFFPVGTAVANAPLQLEAQIGLDNNGFAPFGGTVTITDITGATPVVLGSGPVDGSATGCDCVVVQTTFATAGHHLLRFTYSGDANVKGFVATPFVDINANAQSNVTLSADLPTAPVGAAVTLTAYVDNSDVRQHPATGTITFLDGAAPIGTGVLDSTGTATLVIKTLTGGPHNLTASYPGDSVLTPSVSTPITEMISDYIFQAPASLTIQDGQTGTATLNIIPLGGFSQPVQVSCGSVPANVSCSFSPASITPDGVHPATITLAIKTGGAVASKAGEGRLWAATSTFGLAGLLLPFGWRKRRRVQTTVAALGLIFVGLCVSGCSGGGSSSGSAAAGSYTVTVNATAGAGAPTKTASMTVNIIK